MDWIKGGRDPLLKRLEPIKLNPGRIRIDKGFVLTQYAIEFIDKLNKNKSSICSHRF